MKRIISDKVNNMSGIIPKLKRLFVEPKIYALVLESKRGAILHLGVHYSLDEAIKAASPALEKLRPNGKVDYIGLDMWTVLSGADVIKAISSPQKDLSTPLTLVDNQHPSTAEEQIKLIKETKNNLMQSLIAKGDLKTLDKARKFLSKTERTYIMDRITQGLNDAQTQK